jgi:antitoxin component YwqK of YwqJK toxin-antitoxin module
VRAVFAFGSLARAWMLALAPISLCAACGVRVVDYADGVPRAEGRRTWPERREQGFWSYAYPSGVLREQGRYEDGHRVGLWEQWYPNSLPRSRGERRYHPETSSSEREGVWTLWHANGERCAVGAYVAGKREGHWDFMHSDGGLDGDRTGEYHDDVRID